MEPDRDEGPRPVTITEIVLTENGVETVRTPALLVEIPWPDVRGRPRPPEAHEDKVARVRARIERDAGPLDWED